MEEPDAVVGRTCRSTLACAVFLQERAGKSAQPFTVHSSSSGLSQTLIYLKGVKWTVLRLQSLAQGQNPPDMRGEDPFQQSHSFFSFIRKSQGSIMIF